MSTITVNEEIKNRLDDITRHLNISKEEVIETALSIFESTFREKKEKKSDEWLRQAEYDMETADYLFAGGKYFYAVFMSHLSIEKAFKGLYFNKFKENPPKTHNLIFLIELIDLNIPDQLFNVVFTLNRVSVPARYPDNLQKMLKEFNKLKTKEILEQSKEVLKWLKVKL